MLTEKAAFSGRFRAGAHVGCIEWPCISAMHCIVGAETLRAHQCRFGRRGARRANAELAVLHLPEPRQAGCLAVLAGAGVGAATQTAATQDAAGPAVLGICARIHAVAIAQQQTGGAAARARARCARIISRARRTPRQHPPSSKPPANGPPRLNLTTRTLFFPALSRGRLTLGVSSSKKRP